MAAETARGSLLVNGDFEAGNAGFSTEYAFTPATTNLDARQYVIVSNPDPFHPLAASYGDHTTGSGLMMMVNGAVEPNVVVWTETIAVAPNSDYLFSFWVSSCLAGSPAQLEVLFNGSSIGTFAAPLVAGQWQERSANWNSGSGSILAISIIDRNIEGSGNDFALDDISLQGPAAVPEPSSLVSAALGLAALAGYTGWRRRQRTRLE